MNHTILAVRIAMLLTLLLKIKISIKYVPPACEYVTDDGRRDQQDMWQTVWIAMPIHRRGYML
jgi:hypothetical protein